MCQRCQNSVMDCDRYGESKFLGKTKPSISAEADGHVGVAAEVEVDLKGVGGHAVPRVDGAERSGFERQIGDLPARVGDQHLLRQAEREERDAPRELGRGALAEVQLILDLRIADDRAGDELRIHHLEAEKVAEALHGRRMAAVDVDDVAERLQDVQADAERQRDAQRHVQPHAGSPSQSTRSL